MNTLLTQNDITEEVLLTQEHFKLSPIYPTIAFHLNKIKFTHELVYNRNWRKAFGLCIYSGINNPFVLKFNGWMMSPLPFNEVRDTIRHEYAHLLHFMLVHHKVFPAAPYHGTDWKRLAVACGAKPQQTSKSSKVGTLGKLIEVKSLSSGKTYAITYKEYLNKKELLANVDRFILRVATKNEVLDPLLLKTLDTIKL